MERNDEEIREEIQAQLRKDPVIDATFVDVWSSEGVVGLSGCVDTEYERWRVSRVARQVEGVREVVSYLAVARRAAGVADKQILTDCRRALAEDFDRIRVSVEEGTVLLRGSVREPSSVDRMEDQVRRLHGVRDVTNLLIVERSAPPPSRVEQRGTASV